MPSIVTPRKALNKAYLKVKPIRSEFDRFKLNLSKLFTQINDKESEEFHKNVLADFLKNTFYSPFFYINTKGHNDLVIHNDKAATASVGVIIEAKRASHSNEMVTQDNLNAKAMQELVLYYLRERVGNKNLEVKHLIATNINEWFIFDASVFEKHFAQDAKLVKQFVDFTAGRLSGKTTEFFYANIAKPAIDVVKDELEFTYVNIHQFAAALKSSDKGKDNTLIPLFKLLSPQHLLKTPFVNDSNTLNKGFYTELLHIIGLEEVKTKGRSLIARNAEGHRHSGTLIENAIIQIESVDKLARLPNRTQYGESKGSQLFNVAIELAITWVDRILFLKLLEAQLITYHKGDGSYAFLNVGRVKTFDELNTLFFQVLAVKTSERNADVSAKFAKVPYLNSSLFEPAAIEHNAIFISSLGDEKTIPVLSTTVLKDSSGKRIGGELRAIEYLFRFLDAYDFAGDTGDAIQEDSKTLINASVLGLIFEKINGYKDGSFFTPGFVTMFMSREAIRKAVVQKFNDSKAWNCSSVGELYNKIGIEGRDEANAIINSIKICDPAVGSGHFLVSALNELIAIKAELRLLQDKEGKRLKEYNIEIANDELIVSDEDGQLLAYNPKSAESQRVQETLFNEKLAIIENCLFGVDINPNSVKICRLRLWIELLKYAYYKSDGELETLPNIDINIKTGNSLISRFSLDTDLKGSLKKYNLSFDSYRQAVKTYRNAESKEQKWSMEALIKDIKSDLRTEILYHDPKIKRLENVRAELKLLELPQTLLEESVSEKKARKQKQEKLKLEFNRLTAAIEEIKNNRIYEDAFEWRFEFPEALADNGDYVGFDVVIGNPPYGVSTKDKAIRQYVTSNLGKVPDFEIYYMFINLAQMLLATKQILSLIVPNTLLFNVYAKEYRLNLLTELDLVEILDCTKFKLFDDATVKNIIITARKDTGNNIGYRNTADARNFAELIRMPMSYVDYAIARQNNTNWGLLFKLDNIATQIITAIRNGSVPLSSYFPNVSQGLIAYDAVKKQDKSFIKNRTLHTTVKTVGACKHWLNGEDVKRYRVAWNAKDYFEYSDRVANPRQPKFFKGERILVREITNPRIYAAYTNRELYHDPAVIVILKSNSISTLALLAIMNSKIATYYHFNASPKATKGAFPKILVTDIFNFPLPNTIDVKAAKRLHDLALVAIDSQSPIADEEIDKIVYKLYGLNSNQIDCIEDYFAK